MVEHHSIQQTEFGLGPLGFFPGLSNIKVEVFLHRKSSGFKLHYLLLFMFFIYNHFYVMVERHSIQRTELGLVLLGFFQGLSNIKVEVFLHRKSRGYNCNTYYYWRSLFIILLYVMVERHSIQRTQLGLVPLGFFSGLSNIKVEVFLFRKLCGSEMK